MKTKKQLFKEAKTGPDPKYNTLLSILEAVTDTRNIYLTCIMEEEGEDITTMKAEMRNVYRKEIEDRENKEKIYTEQVEQIAKARVEQKKLEDKNG